MRWTVGNELECWFCVVSRFPGHHWERKECASQHWLSWRLCWGRERSTRVIQYWTATLNSSSRSPVTGSTTVLTRPPVFVTPTTSSVFLKLPILSLDTPICTGRRVYSTGLIAPFRIIQTWRKWSDHFTLFRHALHLQKYECFLQPLEFACCYTFTGIMNFNNSRPWTVKLSWQHQRCPPVYFLWPPTTSNSW